jgi:hypothetical protein
MKDSKDYNKRETQLKKARKNKKIKGTKNEGRKIYN